MPPTPEAIRFAGEALRQGKLVGLPTETVYGIAANAMNADAARSTFELKGRPADNPLIVHVASMDQVLLVARSIPDYATRLAEAFWPGPLTLVLPKLPNVPDEVTAGLQTVAVRLPYHPTARAIIEAAGVPLSAPSANLFMGLSPTQADHIAPAILAGLACVIDGGPCQVGLESTVVDCTGDRPVVLRPGGITRRQIESIVGALSETLPADRRSPGSYRRHYSPVTPVRLAQRLEPQQAGITFEAPENPNQIQLSSDPEPYSRELYRTLFELDQLNLDEIVVQLPPAAPQWEAVHDRLKKAASH